MHGRSDSGEAGRELRKRWWRIENACPQGYLEHNIVEGRRQVDRVLRSWLVEPTVRNVLDIGCGHGTTADLLAAEGVDVTALDCQVSPLAWASVKTARFLVADGCRLPFRSHQFSAVVVREVLEQMSADERRGLLKALSAKPADRLVLVTRLAGRWQRFSERLASLPGLETIDSVEILRSVHLGTPYQLIRRKEVSSRHYRAQIAEFRLSHGGADDSTGFEVG